MKKEGTSPTLRAALWYLKKMKWSVIPQRRNKEPMVPWKKYQTELPTEKEVREWFVEWPDANIALVTGKVSGVTVIDIDGPQGMEIMDELLPESIKTPTVRTPKGGRHLHFQYDPRLVSRSRDLVDIDTKNDGGLVTLPPSVGQNGNPYVWLDSFNITNLPLAQVPESYINAVSKNQDSRYPARRVEDIDVAFTKGMRDETLFHISHTLVKGGMQPENVEKVLIQLAGSCVPPFPKREALIKVRSAVERAFRSERNLPQEIKDWIGVTSGVFSVSDIYSSMILTTPEDKANARQILRRLKDGGFIEPYGKKADVYRRADTECIPMDFRAAKVEPLDIKWPLNIHEYFNTYSKNIAIVAGTKDAGKTCFFMDFIKRNMGKWEIHYFNSEMSEEELRMRLDKHEDIGIEEWNFHAWERGTDFADVVRPNAINIVDYLEINKDFSEIGDWIKAIHEKMEKGICLIGVQKDYGVPWGRGKCFTMQRPRLYITLDGGENRASILVAKNRKNPEINPTGMICHYKIFGGWQITMSDFWHRPEKEDM